MPNIIFAPDLRAVAKIEAVPMILRLVKNLTGMRFAAVARVTEKHWVTCAVDDTISFGLKPGDELVLESTICHEIRQHRQPVVFGNASEHPIYSKHHTPKTYKLESYISIPIIRANGEFFGTLCAIDPAPNDIEKPEIVETLTLFAQLVAANLDMQASVDESETELLDLKEIGRFRDQFIAVLGHDLRTPLSSIRMSSDYLETKLENPKERRLVTAIRNSAQRMSALIENILDFARGQLGSGIPVKRIVTENLKHNLERTISEIHSSNPDAIIEQSIDITRPALCDPGRIEQLLSNLLGNAVTHGEIGKPVHVDIYVKDDDLIINVKNSGNPIPPALLGSLFSPFTRSELNQHSEGLGLGLYIASEIVKGHDGTISVASTEDDGTCFVARFPIA